MTNENNDTPTRRTDVGQPGATFGNFGFDVPSCTPGQSVDAVNGIEVVSSTTRMGQQRPCNSSRISVQLSWNGGTSWTTATDEHQPGLDTNDDNDYDFGDNNSLTPGRAHLGPGRLRRTANFRGPADVGQGLQLRTRRRSARPAARSWPTTTSITPTTQTVTTTTPITDENLRGPGAACLNGVANCFQATGATLNPRGFWGTLLTRGRRQHQRRRVPALLRRPDQPDQPGLLRGIGGEPRVLRPRSPTTTTRSRCRRTPRVGPSTSTTRSSARSRTTRAPATAGSAAPTRSARSTRSTTPGTRCTTRATTSSWRRRAACSGTSRRPTPRWAAATAPTSAATRPTTRTATVATTTTSGTCSTPG